MKLDDASRLTGETPRTVGEECSVDVTLNSAGRPFILVIEMSNMPD